MGEVVYLDDYREFDEAPTFEDHEWCPKCESFQYIDGFCATTDEECWFNER